MNQKVLKREVEQWRNEGIISEEQMQVILLRYAGKKNYPYLLLTFAGLFIGLGFLTFIASNWDGITDFGKMAIIIVALLTFYLGGNYLYHQFSVRLGVSFILIGLLIFGAGIFLTGQMYHYIFLSAVPFVVWSLAGLALFMLYPHASIFLMAILINTVGQLYSGMVYQEVSYILLILLIFGFGHYVYHQEKLLYSYLFAGSFAVQMLVLCLAEQQPYYWLCVFFLVLYLLSRLIHKQVLQRSFRHVGLITGFGLVVFQVFFLSESFWRNVLELNSWFFIVWGILFAGTVATGLIKQEKLRITDLALFLPVFLIPLADMAAMLLLFVFFAWLSACRIRGTDTRQNYHRHYCFFV